MYKIILFASAILLGACGGNTQKKTEGKLAVKTEEAAQLPDMHTAETSLDYAGTYAGTLPAADCPGIETELKLEDDGSYTLTESYIDRNTTLHEKGEYTVRGNLLTLNGDNEVSYYKVEENRLRRLDADKKAVEGPLADHYILTKTN